MATAKVTYSFPSLLPLPLSSLSLPLAAAAVLKNAYTFYKYLVMLIHNFKYIILKLVA